MSNFATPSSIFEADFHTRFLPLSKRLTKMEIKLQKLLVSSMRNPRTSSIYWRAVRREITLIYQQMNEVYASWSKSQIKGRYGRSLQKMNARIQVMKSVSNSAQRGILDILNSRASTQIVSTLYGSAVDSFLNATALGQRNLFRLTRMTQQTLIQESLIDVTIAAGFDLGDLRKAADALSGQLWSKLWESAEGGNFVQAGARKFTPQYYAELVARTKFHDAQSQAALMTAANYDTDLIQVSTHNTTTRICIPFEGKIYSISGTSKLFPPLFDTSPFHVNCLHLMFPAFISAMETQGTLKSFSAFSRDEIT